MFTTIKATFITIIVLLIIGAITLVGWRVGWWFQEHNVEMQRDVNRNSQQYQDSLISQEEDRAQGYANSDNAAQKKQLAETFCSVYANIVNPPNDLQSDFATMCG